MNKSEFDQLRNLPGKVITTDIIFTEKKDAGSETLVFDQVEVKNSLGLDISLNGTYKRNIPSVTFNFVIRGVGPICRICMNGTVHGSAGRTHKHEFQSENDPRLNLPNAIPRPDLEGKSVREIWQSLCVQANINHMGILNEPDGGES